MVVLSYQQAKFAKLPQKTVRNWGCCFLTVVYIQLLCVLEVGIDFKISNLLQFSVDFLPLLLEVQIKIRVL